MNQESTIHAQYDLYRCAMPTPKPNESDAVKDIDINEIFGIDPVASQRLYNSVEKNQYKAPLYACFKALNAFGVKIKEDIALYELAVRHSKDGDEHAKAILALKEMGGSIQQDESLVNAILEVEGEEAKAIAQGFEIVNAMGVSLELDSDRSAFRHVVRYFRKHSDIMAGLHQIGLNIKVKAHLELYMAACQGGKTPDLFCPKLEALIAMGFNPIEENALFAEAIETAHCQCMHCREHGYPEGFNTKDALINTLSILKSAGFELPQHQSLYLSAIREVEHYMEFVPALVFLKDQEAPVMLFVNAIRDHISAIDIVIQYRESHAASQKSDVAEIEKLPSQRPKSEIKPLIDLKKAFNIKKDKDESLYNAIEEFELNHGVNSYQWLLLCLSFDELRNTGISSDEVTLLQHAIVQCTLEEQEILVHGIRELKKIGIKITFPLLEVMFKQKFDKKDNIWNVLSLLKQHGVSTDSYQKLYISAMKHRVSCDDITQLRDTFNIYPNEKIKPAVYIGLFLYAFENKDHKENIKYAIELAKLIEDKFHTVIFIVERMLAIDKRSDELDIVSALRHQMNSYMPSYSNELMKHPARLPTYYKGLIESSETKVDEEKLQQQINDQIRFFNFFATDFEALGDKRLLLYKSVLDNGKHIKAIRNWFDMLIRDFRADLGRHTALYDLAIKKGHLWNDKLEYLLDRLLSAALHFNNDEIVSNTAKEANLIWLLSAIINIDNYHIPLLKNIFYTIELSDKSIGAHFRCFQILIENLDNKYNSAILSECKRLGVSIKTHPSLCESILEEVNRSKEVRGAQYLGLLRDINHKGFILEKHSEIYIKCFSKIKYFDDISSNWDMLIELNVDIDSFPECFEAVIDVVNNVDIDEFPEYFEAVIDVVNKDQSKTSYKKTLIQKFELLKNLGADIQSFPLLYKAIIKYRAPLEPLESLFNLLKGQGLTLTEDHDIYQYVIREQNQSQVFLSALEVLKTFDLRLIKSPDGFKKDSIEKSLSIASTYHPLSALGIDKKVFTAFYDKAMSEVEKMSSFSMLLAHLDIEMCESERALVKFILDNSPHNNMRMATALCALNDVGANLKRDKHLYRLVAEKSDDADIVAFVIYLLQKLKVDIERSDIYQRVIELVCQGKCLHELLSTYDNHREVSLWVVGLWARSPGYDAAGMNRLRAAFRIIQECAYPPEEAFCLNRLVLESAATPYHIKETVEKLREAGCEPQKNFYLYQKALSNDNALSSIVQLISSLQPLGIAIDRDFNFYEKAVRSSYPLSDIVKMIQCLNEQGGSIEKHYALYEKGLDKTYRIDSVIPLITFIKKLGFSFDTDSDLFLCMLIHSYELEPTEKFVMALRVQGLSLDKHHNLYGVCLEKIYNWEQIIDSIKLLSALGASIEKHHEIYDYVIQKDINIGAWSPFFIRFKQLGGSFDERLPFYEELIERCHLFDRGMMLEALETLISFGARLQRDSSLFMSLIKQHLNLSDINDAFGRMKVLHFSSMINLSISQMVIDRPTEGLRIVDNVTRLICIFELTEKQIGAHLNYVMDEKNYLPDLSVFVKTHSWCLPLVPNILDIIFNKSLSKSEFLHSLYALQHFYQSQNAPDLNLKKNRRRCLDVFNDHYVTQYQEGPLQKTDATTLYQTLLLEVASRGQRALNGDIRFSFHPSVGYMLNLDGKTYYLNLLIKDANLSHLNIDERSINALGDILHRLGGLSQGDGYFDRDKVKHLHPVLQLALRQYVGIKKYRNINRFLRGEEFSDEPKYRWLIPTDGNNNILANFICASLIQVALNLLYTDEQIFDLPDILVRGEKLTDEHINRRLANPYKLDCFASFSTKREGESTFNQKGTTRTELNCKSRLFRVVNTEEGEVIVPHATRIKYFKVSESDTLNQKILHAEIINSPSLEREHSYSALYALKKAYDLYLSQPYKDRKSDRSINGVNIARPNHGLAHSFRVMTMTRWALDYFARHANNEGFKAFCQFLSEPQRNALAIAAAFSVTGRESEISAREDITLYKRYRKASHDNLGQFLEANPEIIPDAGLSASILHVLLHMGDPNYENDGEGFPLFDPTLSDDERALRIFLHRILNTAHKLDLPRCYHVNEFQHVFDYVLSLSETSVTQQFDFKAILFYNLALMKAHGNAMCIDCTPNGELVNKYDKYQEIFAKTSTEMLRLINVSQIVEEPSLSQLSPLHQDKVDETRETEYEQEGSQLGKNANNRSCSIL